MNNYTDYPFTVNGVNFISRIYSHSSLRKTIEALPAGVFTEMNKQAITELLGDPSLMSTPELLKELTAVNLGGSHSFIMLGENN